MSDDRTRGWLREYERTREPQAAVHVCESLLRERGDPPEPGPGECLCRECGRRRVAFVHGALPELTRDNALVAVITQSLGVLSTEDALVAALRAIGTLSDQMSMLRMHQFMVQLPAPFLVEVRDDGPVHHVDTSHNSLGVVQDRP